MNIEATSSTDTFETALPARYLEAFVQKNALTYENKWRRMLAKKGTPEKMGWAISWNWGAFLFFLPWLFYRKLYGAAAIIIGLTILLNIWEVVIGKDLTASLFWFGLVTGLFGNAWYFKRTRKAIAAAESLYQEPDKIERALREQGGTSWLALVGGLLILIVINLVTTMVRDPEFWSAFMRGVHGGAKAPTLSRSKASSLSSVSNRNSIHRRQPMIQNRIVPNSIGPQATSFAGAQKPAARQSARLTRNGILLVVACADAALITNKASASECSSPEAIEMAKNLITKEYTKETLKMPGWEGALCELGDPEAQMMASVGAVTLDDIRTTDVNNETGALLCEATTKLTIKRLEILKDQPIPPISEIGPFTATYKIEKTDDGGLYMSLLTLGE